MGLSLSNDDSTRIPITVASLDSIKDGSNLSAQGIPYGYDSSASNSVSYDLPGQSTSSSAPSASTIDSILLDNSTLNGTLVTSSNNATNTDDFRLNLFGTYVYPFRWITLPTLPTLYSWLGPLSSLAMIIGCVMPYVPQYLTIYKNRSCSGFSTFVCLTLLLANILRVAFWFGHPFEIPLLVQSFIMILAQILLLELCVRVKRQPTGYLKERTFFSCNPRYFWRWTNLVSYLEFLVLISALLGIAMYYFIDSKPFVETIGYCALVTESMLGLPQVIKNFKNKSVAGMSLSMVLMWLAGDSFKTGYFIANDVPFQFWLCGLLQISIDLLILFQVCLFRQNAPIKMNELMTRNRK